MFPAVGVVPAAARTPRSGIWRSRPRVEPILVNPQDFPSHVARPTPVDRQTLNDQRS